MAKKQTKGAPEAQDKNPETWTEIAPAAVHTEAAESAPAPKKPRKAKAEPAAAAPEPQVEVAAAPGPKKGKRTKEGATLETVFAGYLKGLENDGKSDGTINSYRMELVLAGDELGLETKVADLTPEKVLRFFGCDRVMRKRNKKPKSPLSIDKTRRVLRQALQWAETAKLIVKAPVPELAASH